MAENVKDEQMLKSHERFHSSNGKRLVLIADDEYINREIMRSVLEESYELIFAENGEETLAQMRAHSETLSLVLLDLMMPVLSGLDALKQAKADPEIARIPIIVITSDQDAEVETLTLGATDFIPKPYPQAGVILARVLRTIELSEDRQIINSTERDELTGLYNREYFYRYAEQYDQHHRDVKMDALVVDVNHFHMINERFGTAYGDEVLRNIGQALRDMVIDTGGIVCRREADTFLVYCPHGKDYEQLLDTVSARLKVGDDENRIWLRMGVYADVDKELDVERRFDRAKMAADTVQGSFTALVGFYDIALHERELYSEQLIEGFSTAIKEHQFQVYYQPKFDVQPVIPVLASAEALVRWKHPELGMISPGMFIPLFEENGLIQRLDMYVWHTAAAQIHDWKERFGFAVPVSVNVSRIDMYDPHLVDTFLKILEENNLTTNDFRLEITESAYTQDSEQIISTVNKLRRLGFKVEMDDFGTGYSSLNMISTLPIDVLKMDMQFIRGAFADGGDTKMLEVIIDIADYLSIPVIAEGVETEEQMIALREMGCDYVQGYYFSAPVPADDYEKFVIERKEMIDAGLYVEEAADRVPSRKDPAIGEIAHALTSGYEAIYYVDTETNHYVEFTSHGRSEDLQIEQSGPDFFAGALAHLFKDLCEEDRQRVELSSEKEALIAQVAGPEPFIMTYRVMKEGTPVPYYMKAVRARTHDDHHIVIGISNVEEQLRELNGSNELDFGSLAQALSNDMESIYYVDVRSDTYMVYHASGYLKKLELDLSGSDFFGECTANVKQVVHPDDQDMLLGALDKETLLSVLEQRGVFSLTYRLIIEDTPLFYNLKAVWAGDAGSGHVIIGVSNVDAQMADQEKLEAKFLNGVTYTSIVQALATDYFSIYYVDTETGEFIEYGSHEMFGALGVEANGACFFQTGKSMIEDAVFADDKEMFAEAFTKENILATLDKERVFTLTCRLSLGSAPKYVNFKAARMTDAADSHIVIGISDVDDQIRREREHDQALRLANQDALTGVKSLHAYMEESRKIDSVIQADEQEAFAVAVCDINGLKQVNDTLGHGAGDQLIKDACKIVCNIFKHSPVFRVGGDEFVVILRNGDYDARANLMAQLAQSNARALAVEGGVCVAGGLSEYRPGADAALSDVFERADAAMYENKKKLKAA